MKKSTIWLLAIIMGLTLVGLLYIQLMYLSNIVKMRNDQFSEGVRRSLSTVSNELEKREARLFLDADSTTFSSSVNQNVRSSSRGNDVSAINYSFSTSDVKGDITLRGNIAGLPSVSKGSPSSRLRSMQEDLHGRYLYQKELLDQVVLSIVSQADTRPIEERADSATTAAYIKAELANNGLDLPFEFAVVNRTGQVIYKTAGYQAGDAGQDNMFVQMLFPNDSQNKMNYIKVYFPTKKDYILSAVRYMIPSFIFTCILFLVFLYTIIVAFRQKKLTEMKNDFINNMTHEFKTPISTISLAAQMLNDSAVLKSPAMFQHISTVINDETKRLRFQVEKVLQMSMFDRQKATLKLQDVDVNVAIANITSTFKLKVEKYGGRIEANLDAEDSVVYVDEMHFTNVIFNLLDNAVKYRREDVPLKLTVGTRDISGHRVRITVADNGIGIKKENLKKIFEKFYRVSTGNRHDVKGFGLGLAYVQKMVNELNGEITVESELNVGTKFIIILPLTKND